MNMILKGGACTSKRAPTKKAGQKFNQFYLLQQLMICQVKSFANQINIKQETTENDL